jgi:hypothetical protein
MRKGKRRKGCSEKRYLIIGGKQNIYGAENINAVPARPSVKVDCRQGKAFVK